MPEHTTEGEKAPEHQNKQPNGRGRLSPSWRTAGASRALIRVRKILRLYPCPHSLLLLLQPPAAATEGCRCRHHRPCACCDSAYSWAL